MLPLESEYTQCAIAVGHEWLAMDNPIPIKKFVLFDPARVHEIVVAFEDACSAVAQQPPSDKVREILAKCITEAAQRGEWDRVRLRDEALAYLAALMSGD
jgi:hypothetical protein